MTPTTKRLLLPRPALSALLGGRKTQHRFLPKSYIEFGDTGRLSSDEQAALLEQAYTLGKCRYENGDLLYVGESYAIVPRTAYAHDPTTPHVEDGDWWYIYREGWDRSQSGIAWKPASTMPRHVARFWLKLTDVVMHPIQDISPMEARGEGVEERWNGFTNYLKKGHSFSVGRQYTYNDQSYPAEIMSYISLFEHLNGLHSWDQNPAVVALTWKQTSPPI